MKVLGLVAGLLFASVAVGQDNFPDIPDNYFEKRFVTALKLHGWYRGPKTFRNSVLTPLEEAQVVVQTVNALEENLRKEIVEIKRLIDSRQVGNTKSLIEFSIFLNGSLTEMGLRLWARTLVDRHTSRFSQLGTSREEMLKMLEACGEPLAELSRLYGQAIGISRETGDSAMFRFSPQHDDLARTLALLKAEGWLVSQELQGDSLFPNPPMRRESIARAAIDTLPTLRKHLDSAVREWDFSTSGSDKTSLTWMHRNRENYAIGIERGLVLWIREFAPDIRALGGDVAALQKHIESCRKPLAQLAARQSQAIHQLGGAPAFPDVPFRHWASDAIQELRDAGLLKGYPDGKFRG